MPAITRWYVKTALASLVASLALATLIALGPLADLPAWVRAAGPVYYHLFLVGWATQLIMGVVFWMFPKASRERPQGSPRLAAAVYVALNAGLVLRAVAEPAAAVDDAPAWRAALVASALLQGLAGLGFVANTWGRVKER